MQRRLDFIMTLSLLALGAGCGDDGGGSADDTTGDTSTGGDPSTTLPPDTSATLTTTDGTTTTVDTSTTGETDTDTTGEDATLLERIIEGLGGEENFDDLEAFELTVSGSRTFPDEAAEPGGPPAPANDFDNTVTVDVPSSSLLVDVSRTLTFEELGVPQTFQEIVQDQLGHVDGTENLLGFPTGDLTSDRWAAIVREQRLLNPHLILKDVLADPTIASETGEQEYDGRPHELLEVASTPTPIVFWVDSETDLISRVTLQENHPLRRDVEIEATYADWDSATDVLFPAQVEILLDGEAVHSEQRDDVVLNPDLAADTFDFPDGADPAFVEADAERGERNHQWHRSFASVGLPQSGEQTFIEATEVAPGLHWLTGGSHHSVVVEQDAGVVVLEAPLYEARSVAILDWIDTNLDSATTTHVVASHFHQDHSAGIRTFVARGATLVIGAGAEDLWDTVLAAPSTIEPDELEADPVADPPIMVVPNDDVLLLDDTTNPISIYDLETEHSDDMLLPFVDSAGAAFVVDLYSPGFPNQIIAAGPQDVLDSFTTHDITNDVNLIIGGHGIGTATIDDLIAAAGG